MSKWLNDFPDRFVVNLFQSLGIAFHLGVVSSCGDPKFRFNVPDVLTVTPSIEKALDVVLTVEDTEGLRSALESLGNAITNNKIYPGTAEDAVREKLSGKFEFVKNDGGEVDFVYNGKTGKIVMAHNVGEENGFTACLKWCNCLKIINRRFVLNPVTCGISPGVLLKTSSLRRQDIEIFKQKIVCGKGNEADKIQYGFGENPPSVLLTSTLVGEIGSLWCRFPELFPKDFTSKVIFSKWDFAAGTVVVSIDQVGPITCKFHDVKGFSSLVIVSNMGVNDTNVVMEFNGVPVTILYNDLQAFQSSCTNLQIFSNHKPFKVKGESGIFKLVNGKNGDPLHYVVFYTKEATGTQVPVKKNEEAAYKSKMLMFNKLMGGIDPRKT